MTSEQPNCTRNDSSSVVSAVAVRAAVCFCLAIGSTNGGNASAESPLDVPVRGSWTGTPLRDWVEQMSGIAGRPVILDRRLDPDLPVTRQCRGEPVGEVLGDVAKAVDAEVVELRSTIRIAPRPVAADLGRAEAARDRELAKLPKRQRAPPQASRPWTWPNGARPADLVAAAAADAAVPIVGLDSIPHDHLAGRTLPPLSLAERLDLVLADYEKRISWRPADEGEALTAVIVPLTAGLGTAVAVDKPPRTKPSAPPGEKPAAQGTIRFTLRAAAPLDQLLASVSGQLGLTLAVDQEALAERGIAPGEIVRLELKEASRDQLLDAIVKPLKLGWRIDGDTLQIGAPAPAAD
jgi:hypothetical protein